MKKYIILVCSFLFIQNFVYSQGYQNGYDIGHYFGFNWVSEYVATHPQFGQTFNYSGSTVLSQSNYYGSGTATGMPLTTNGVYVYNSTVGFSNFQIAEYAISSLWATNAYSWLLQTAITTNDQFHWGVYDGFMIGTYDAMWSFQ